MSGHQINYTFYKQVKITFAPQGGSWGPENHSCVSGCVRAMVVRSWFSFIDWWISAVKKALIVVLKLLCERQL